jgi:hypothetical protein
MKGEFLSVPDEVWEVTPNANVASVLPDDPQWAQRAWQELRRFEEERLGGPRIETLAALARLAWDAVVPERRGH